MQIGDLSRTQHSRERRDDAARQAMRVLLVIGLMTSGSLALWLSAGSTAPTDGMVTAAPPQILAGERQIVEPLRRSERVQVANADPAAPIAASGHPAETAYLPASVPALLADEQVFASPEPVETAIGQAEQAVPAPPADISMTGAVSRHASLAEPARSENPGADPLDLNRASFEQLNSLKGAGALGRAIIKGRPYRSVDDLVKKKVLRRAIFEKIKDQVTVQ